MEHQLWLLLGIFFISVLNRGGGGVKKTTLYVQLRFSFTVFNQLVDRTWQQDADQGGEDQDQGQDQAALALANLDVEGPPGPKKENNNNNNNSKDNNNKDNINNDNNNSKGNNNNTLGFVQGLCWVYTTK